MISRCDSRICLKLIRLRQSYDSKEMRRKQWEEIFVSKIHWLCLIFRWWSPAIGNGTTNIAICNVILYEIWESQNLFLSIKIVLDVPITHQKDQSRHKNTQMICVCKSPMKIVVSNSKSVSVGLCKTRSDNRIANLTGNNSSIMTWRKQTWYSVRNVERNRSIDSPICSAEARLLANFILLSEAGKATTKPFSNNCKMLAMIKGNREIDWQEVLQKDLLPWQMSFWIVKSDRRHLE